MTVRPIDQKFLREPPPGWRIGDKVRCWKPGMWHQLVENDVYTIDWIDWPFCLSVAEIPDMTWDRVRFTTWNGPLP